MIRINLLPHREEKRKERRRLFLFAAIGDAVIALAVIGLVYFYFDREIATQNDRNAFLKRENAKLDTEIEEIQKLKEETDRLLARKQVIERLQGDRSEPVILLDQLAKRVPDGVYLKSVEQTGSKVKIVGYAQSSARVSTLMRNIDASPNMEGADLEEIKAALQDKRRLNEFTLDFRMKRVTADDGSKKGGPAVAKAGPAGAPGPAPAAAGPDRDKPFAPIDMNKPGSALEAVKREDAKNGSTGVAPAPDRDKAFAPIDMNKPGSALDAVKAEDARAAQAKKAN